MGDCFVIRNARIIDPSQKLDQEISIVVENGKVRSLGGDAAPTTVIDGRGCIVTPGWIDAHVHVYEHCTPLGINADKYCLSRGVTTVVDAGSAGATTYPGFQKYVVESCETRVYTLLHIALHGLASAGCAGIAGGECDSLNQVSSAQCLARIRQCADNIVGVKVRLSADVAADGQLEAEAFRRALTCAEQANLPLMTHHSISSIPTQMKCPDKAHGEKGLGCPSSLKTGDIYTHCFHGWESSILDNLSGKLTLHPDVLAARERGVYFDVGHGRGSFHWGVAEQCAKLGFYPDIISTDLHVENIDGPAYDLATIMSKMLHVGMPLNEIVKAVTSTPAIAIHREHIIGSLMVGTEADLTMFKVEDCDVDLEDCSGQIRKISQRIKPLRVWRAGKEHRINDIEAWPNRSKWSVIASDWHRLEVKDSDKPSYLK